MAVLYFNAHVEWIRIALEMGFSDFKQLIWMDQVNKGVLNSNTKFSSHNKA